MEEATKRVNDWLSANNSNAPLYLSYLGLEKLPPIPHTCKALYCHNNKLTSLPELPNCVCLYCFENQLTSLPELPNCVILSCFNNNLTHLPQLPVCKAPYCYRNQYLHINKHQAKKFFITETPNYNKSAIIVQRNYKKYLRKKYQEMVNQFLFLGPTKIVCLYVT